MKSIFLALVLLPYFGIISAQNISGKAYYQSKTTVDMDRVGPPDMSEDMKKQMKERMKKHLEKTFILTFQGKESIYEEEEALDTGEGNRGFGMMVSSFTPGEQYKNLETQQLLEAREFFGKQFLVSDSIPQMDWQIGKESKQIGQYLAIKATAIKAVNPNNFRMMRRRDDRQEKATEMVKDSLKEKDPLDNFEIPKEVLVTAWFTPQIPIQNGPGEYGGLPGLILELNVDRTTILCSKIVLNTKEAMEIKPPSKGEKVTREAFDAVVKKKTDEMRENFRGGDGKRKGGGFRRFGG
ncbi:MAG TPA: GLPGLI family protein [Flavobacteriaceae bacterium]|nr:GLPGLI family protein [Flavobacteriaceae bacterium]HPF12011.1 GLPGLI family protein [Flavobacteriaceae bacterium]HQU21410.1 GLPGLI family protein [Flavobacteriaceae bacterium]HQU65154.1 GLPGLI family protein [Flavobacteriaceae bacterium]HRW45305.1 GLPGLI family protein [Flavobacteriaceae bacterium]